MVETPAWPSVQPLQGREAEIAGILAAIAEGSCVSLVGMSNVGKSFVLRTLCQATVSGAPLPMSLVYIDCNRMVEFSDQGFYELVLRCLRALLAPLAKESALAGKLRRCYEDVVAPGTPFLAHLSFSEAIAATCESLGTRLALVLDEFDEVMDGIGERVLLNLRALRDTYPGRLCYVTATGRRLDTLRRAHGSDEFAELFGQSTRFLAPLEATSALALLGQIVTEQRLSLAPVDAPLIIDESGGHPALLLAVCHALSALRLEAQVMRRPAPSLDQMCWQLDSDPACQAECAKFWQEMGQDERRALLQCKPEDPSWQLAERQSLTERHLMRPSEDGWQLFCQVFARHVHRQRLLRQSDTRGVRIDVEAGDVSVDGRRVPLLTDLEYRLLLLLYGRLDKIVDKYSIVQTVWGEEYIDQVDDARIDKLVSRLRQKLEPDPREARYLLTIRGRGYRLAGP